MQPIFRVLMNASAAQSSQTDVREQKEAAAKKEIDRLLKEEMLAIQEAVNENDLFQKAQQAGDPSAEQHRQAGLAALERHNALKAQRKQLEAEAGAAAKTPPPPPTDITNTLEDRLISLRITDKVGIDSDELEIVLDDRDGAVSLPARGAKLEVSLGYQETGLTRIGRYRIDEVELSGPPQIISLRGRAANMSGNIKAARRHSWEGTTLEAVVRDVATRNKLKPVCRVKASLARVDQVNESDMNFLTRIARDHDATASIKGGQLLVLPRGGQQLSASGKKLPAIALTARELKSWRCTFSDRSAAGAVRVKSHDPKTGKPLEVVVPDKGNPGGPTRTVRHTAASKGQAGAKAKAVLDAEKRKTATLSLTLPGRADLVAERIVALSGIKQGVDGSWTIDTVTHQFSSGGWETDVECAGAKIPDSKKSKPSGKKVAAKRKPLEVVKP